MTYVFGPVTSRRLGRSLGVDPVPFKTCNWNCVYCQLGRTRPVVNERREYCPAEAIAGEVEERLARLDPETVVWVTFVGSGEPLLHARLGWLIHRVKTMTSMPVAVITNGSLLYLPEVRTELIETDAVLPTLDAGNADLYRRLNRPHPAASYERLLEGLQAFRAEYAGWLWPEVTLIRGLNDTREELQQIAERLASIRPDEIHINLPIRPPAEAWVKPPEDDALTLAAAVLGEVAPVRTAEPVDGTLGLSGCEKLADAVIAVISRHPLSEEEIARALRRWGPQRVQETLADLAASSRARLVIRYGKRFWTAAPAYFPDD